MAMLTLSKPARAYSFRFFTTLLTLPGQLDRHAAGRRRRQATIDLIHASPHLRRDIGLVEEHFSGRGR